jgi:hypothetical protein
MVFVMIVPQMLPSCHPEIQAMFPLDLSLAMPSLRNSIKLSKGEWLSPLVLMSIGLHVTIIMPTIDVNRVSMVSGLLAFSRNPVIDTANISYTLCSTR